MRSQYRSKITLRSVDRFVVCRSGGRFEAAHSNSSDILGARAFYFILSRINMHPACVWLPTAIINGGRGVAVGEGKRLAAPSLAIIEVDTRHADLAYQAFRFYEGRGRVGWACRGDSEVVYHVLDIFQVEEAPCVFFIWGRCVAWFVQLNDKHVCVGDIVIHIRRRDSISHRWRLAQGK